MTLVFGRRGSRPDLGAAAVPGGRTLRRLALGRRADVALRAGLMAVVSAGLLAGGLELAATVLTSRHPGGAALATASVPQAWSEVIRPIALYDLSGTAFAKLPRSYAARRHAPDGAREDVMSFGAFGDDRPYLRVALLRTGEAGAGSAPEALTDGLARLAGTEGDTVTRLHVLAPVETRFGRIERADLMLWRGGASRACVGFRGLPGGGTVLRIAGFGCGAKGRTLDAETLACAVDRIDLLSAGDDEPLRLVFVAAERQAGAPSCGGGVLATSIDRPGAPDPYDALRRRAAWLEAGGGAPPLRGAIAASDDER